MRLKHLEIFNAVMLTGTLSGAARLLHITQPAATQALQLAELHLDYALFTRQKNRLVPTAEAMVLYPEVQKLVGQLESVRRLAGAQRQGSSPPLRVLIVPSLAVAQLPSALRLFRADPAAVPLAIRTLHTAEIARAIALREADVGIVYGSAAPPGIDVQPVAQGRLVCVSPDGIGSRRGNAAAATVTLDEVLRQPLVRIDERDALGALLAAEYARLGMQTSGEIVVQTHHLALVLVEQGFGAAVIDSFTATARREGRLCVQAIAPEVPVTVQALLPPGVRPGRAVAAFVDALGRVGVGHWHGGGSWAPAPGGRGH